MSFLHPLKSHQGKLGLILFLAGGAYCLVRLYSAALFYGADERVLYFLPWLAKSTSIEELVQQPERFANKWVKVRAEVWRRTKDDAILVPPGSGPEPIAIGTNQGVLPVPHLYTHQFRSEKVTTVSALDLPQNQAITFAGEFEAVTPTFVQHIDAAAIFDPRQSQFDGAMIRRLFFHTSLVLVGAAIGVMGLLLIRSARMPQGMAAGRPRGAASMDE